MPPKRKPRPTVQHRIVSKKRRKEELLTKLPIEVLDEILCHILPDVTSIDWVEDTHLADNLLTSPILQTNKALRQICFSLIQRRSIWVSLELEDFELATGIFDHLEVPLIHPKLVHLIEPEAARIDLCLRDTSILPQRKTRSISQWESPIIFPFNFDRMLYLGDFVVQTLTGGGTWNLTVKCHNVAGRFNRQIQDLLIPAISMSRRLYKLDFQLEGKTWHPNVVDKHITLRKWSLTDIASKAQDILDRIEKLKQGDYHDEASLLALASEWVLTEARIILPSAYDWSMGESGLHSDAEQPDNDPEDSDSDWGWNSNVPVARNPEGNRFRSSVHRIEYIARLGFAMFVERYGRAWSEDHSYMFESGMTERFLDDDEDEDFSWFGLTFSESVELYYSRARCQEALASIVFDNLSCYFIPHRSGSQPSYEGSTLTPNQRPIIQAAAVNMFCAQSLDPSKEHLDRYFKYRELLGPKLSIEMENVAARRFVIKRDKSDSNNDENEKPVLWAGDIWFLNLWGWDDEYEDEDEEVNGDPDMELNPLRYLTLAHKGLSVSKTFADWGHGRSGGTKHHIQQ